MHTTVQLHVLRNPKAAFITTKGLWHQLVGHPTGLRGRHLTDRHKPFT